MVVTWCFTVFEDWYVCMDEIPDPSKAFKDWYVCMDETPDPNKAFKDWYVGPAASSVKTRNKKV